MEPNLNLKQVILEDDTLRYCEIYKITNLVNKKVYIGQAVSHILNHKKYRPYGMEGRLKTHISEAFSDKKCQCHYLNNAIRKYGSSNFTVELLRACDINDADAIEAEEIQIHNSVFPKGYNLTTGGKTFRSTIESRKRVSDGVVRYFKDKKYEKFADIVIEDITNIDKYVRPLNRNKIQYGWYVYINSKKADFGGSCISLEESKKMAYNFIQTLIELQRNTLMREVP